MEQIEMIDRPSFKERVLSLEEGDMELLERAARRHPSNVATEGDSGTVEAIPFRNVFANHFNNVIRFE